SGDILVIVGPEGGVSPEETAQLTRAGAVATRLGPTVLRTSSAGLVAATIVASRSGRWGRPWPLCPAGRLVRRARLRGRGDLLAHHQGRRSDGLLRLRAHAA